jgi:hypothetical protein
MLTDDDWKDEEKESTVLMGQARLLSIKRSIRLFPSKYIIGVVSCFSGA